MGLATMEKGSREEGRSNEPDCKSGTITLNLWVDTVAFVFADMA